MISELVYDVCPNFWLVKKLVKQLQLRCPQEAKVLGGEKNDWQLLPTYRTKILPVGVWPTPVNTTGKAQAQIKQREQGWEREEVHQDPARRGLQHMVHLEVVDVGESGK